VTTIFIAPVTQLPPSSYSNNCGCPERSNQSYHHIGHKLAIGLASLDEMIGIRSLSGVVYDTCG